MEPFVSFLDQTEQQQLSPSLLKHLKRDIGLQPRRKILKETDAFRAALDSKMPLNELKEEALKSVHKTRWDVHDLLRPGEQPELASRHVGRALHLLQIYNLSYVVHEQIVRMLDGFRRNDPSEEKLAGEKMLQTGRIGAAYEKLARVDSEISDARLSHEFCGWRDSLQSLVKYSDRRWLSAGSFNLRKTQGIVDVSYKKISYDSDGNSEWPEKISLCFPSGTETALRDLVARHVRSRAGRVIGGEDPQWILREAQQYFQC
ncbi:hypothetical protein HY285_04030 [Candidatus Peregrinibacteria bacterium]|nr:hypothetical protein [Candidatus Peregrinibacteria bacterium]MBI3816684.1 hypothetical protein [Candidatus Peregrinibacteria bacterium]